MTGLVPGLAYSRTYPATAWTAPGRASLSGGLSRAALVPGTYIPGPEFNPDTCGVLAATPPTDILSPGADGMFRPDANATYEDKVITGTVLGRAAMGTVRFKNCRLPANRPSQMRAWAAAGGQTVATSSAANNWSSGKLIFEDCEFDHAWWLTQGEVITQGLGIGLSGSNFELRRCFVRGFVDGVNFSGGPNGEGSYVLIDSSRIAGMYYGAAGQSGGYTHNDDFQWGTGKNVEIRYSYLGGPMNPQVPTLETILGYSYNTVLMVQQEQREDGAYLVDGIYIHDNWLAGAVATVNINRKTGFTNTIPGPGLITGRTGNRITNNRFMRKVTGVNDIGYYIRYLTGMQTDVSGNVIWDPTGPITGSGERVPVNEVSNSGSGDVPVATWLS